MRAGGVIPGASSGVGKALALRLAAAGHQALGGQITPVAVDVREYDELSAVIVQARDSHQVDYIINFVGVGFYAPIGANYTRAWNEILATNVTSLLSVLSIIDQHCTDLAAFIHVSSMAAYRMSQTPGNICYSVSKTAARMIVEEYRRQVRTTGRTTKIPMISPGFVAATDFQRSFYSHADESVQRVDLYGAHDNLAPEDVVWVIENVLGYTGHIEVIDIIIAPTGQPL
jgi:NADP-dependent 3-hydroxy acid dehydrogenase YdfG